VILFVVGWLGLVTAFFNGYVKVFEDDAMVQDLFGNRNLDPTIYIFIASIALLALDNIIGRIQQIEARLNETSANVGDDQND
jgi:hypothetical protein